MRNFRRLSAVIARFSGAGLSFVLTTLALRFLGAEQFGHISVIYSSIAAASFLTRLGTDNLLLHRLAPKNSSEQANTDVRKFSELWTIIKISAILVSPICWAYLVWAGHLNVDKPWVDSALQIASIFCAIYFASTLSLVTVQLKMTGRLIYSNLLESLLLQLAIPLYLLAWFAGFGSAIEYIVLLAALAALPSLRVRKNFLGIGKKLLLIETVPYFVSSIGGFVLRWSPPLFAGALYSLNRVGGFNFAFRCSLIIYVLCTALNSVTVSRIFEKTGESFVVSKKQLAGTFAGALAVAFIAFYSSPILEFAANNKDLYFAVDLALLSAASVINGLSLRLETYIVTLGSRRFLSSAYSLSAIIFCAGCIYLPGPYSIGVAACVASISLYLTLYLGLRKIK